MNILITAATGFIGRHITSALIQQGHDVTVCARNVAAVKNKWPEIKVERVDFVSDNDVSAWLDRLNGIEVVINSVGIIHESAKQTFAALHTATPIALFKACEKKGVKKIIQLSALGADENAMVPYQLSKKAADDYLKKLSLDWFVLRPSLVYGEDGTSTKFFNLMASFPLLPLVSGGKQQIQPVHIDDLVDVVLACLSSVETQQVIDVVGPESMAFSEWIQQLRIKKGKGKIYVIPVPYLMMRIVSYIAQYFIPLLSPDNLKMLQQGNVSNSQVMSKFLGRKARVLP